VKKDHVEQKFIIGKAKKDEKVQPKPAPQEQPMGSAVSLKSISSRASRGL